jgi:hypothetical protein
MNIIRILIAFLVVVPAYGQREDPMSPAWDKLHTTAQVYDILNAWNKKYPELTRLYSIGKTLKGTELMVLEITNQKTGPAEDKPAYYYDGNIHAGELTGAEVALRFAWEVLSKYESDARIKTLLDTRTLYIRPKFNPDGADIALSTPQPLRSTPRPYDEDLDGLLDEDTGNDLNKDGIITEMRVKNPNGLWKLSSKDPRVMTKREANETGGEYYDVYDEGTDDDNDGRFNEDGVGGIDMNRNFPREWGMEFEQQGAGPFPLSEPETRATVEFISGHRNITGIFHGHTAAGFLYRLPSTSSWDNFGMEDQQLILELAAMYETTTKQKVVPSYSNPRLHRHGTLISWAYWDYGVVGFVPEFLGAFPADENKDGRTSEEELVKWNDTQLDGKYFVKWQSFSHPQLGPVEIGGLNSRFIRQNPPPAFIKAEIELYLPWMLWLAEVSPRVIIKDVKINSVEKGKVVSLSVTAQNEGYLPTNISQRAIEGKFAVPVRSLISLTDAQLIEGSSREDLGHLEGRRDEGASFGSRKTVTYVIKITGSNPKAMVTIQSEKGGTARKEISLK